MHTSTHMLYMQMLRALKIESAVLLSDDPRQQQALVSCGLNVVATQPRKPLGQQHQQHSEKLHAVTLGKSSCRNSLPWRQDVDAVQFDNV